MADTGMGVTATVTTGLRTDLIDDTVMANVHANQHNMANAAILALQGMSGGGSSGGITLIPPDPTVTPLTLQAAPGQQGNLLNITDQFGNEMVWVDANGTLRLSAAPSNAPSVLNIVNAYDQDLTWFDSSGNLWFSDGTSNNTASLGWGSVMSDAVSGLMSAQAPLLATAWSGFGYFSTNNYNNAWTDPYDGWTAFFSGHNLDDGNFRFQIDHQGRLIWSSYDTNGVVWGNPDVVMSHAQSSANGQGTQGLRIMAGDWQPAVPVLSIIARGSAIHNWRNLPQGRQTGDLLRIQDGESGGIWAKFDAEGRLSLTPNNPAFIPFSITGATGQTGDMAQVQVQGDAHPRVAVTGNEYTSHAGLAIPVGSLALHNGLNTGARPGFLMYANDAPDGGLEVPAFQYFNFGQQGASIWGDNQYGLYLTSGGGDIWVQGGGTVWHDAGISVYNAITTGGEDPSRNGTIFSGGQGPMLFLGQAGIDPGAPSWGVTLFSDSVTNALKAITPDGIVTQLAPASGGSGTAGFPLIDVAPTNRPEYETSITGDNWPRFVIQADGTTYWGTGYQDATVPNNMDAAVLQWMDDSNASGSYGLSLKGSLKIDSSNSYFLLFNGGTMGNYELDSAYSMVVGDQSPVWILKTTGNMLWTARNPDGSSGGTTDVTFGRPLGTPLAQNNGLVVTSENDNIVPFTILGTANPAMNLFEVNVAGGTNPVMTLDANGNIDLPPYSSVNIGGMSLMDGGLNKVFNFGGNNLSVQGLGTATFMGAIEIGSNQDQVDLQVRMAPGQTQNPFEITDSNAATKYFSIDPHGYLWLESTQGGFMQFGDNGQMEIQGSMFVYPQTGHTIGFGIDNSYMGVDQICLMLTSYPMAATQDMLQLQDYSRNILGGIDAHGRYYTGPAPHFGGGTGPMMFLGNDTADPTTNPTGGGIIYVSGGALKYRGSNGTVTTLAPA